MTEVCDRTLRAKGPALLFEKPTGFDMPVLGNLFGTPERVALGMGAEDVGALREIGKLLAQLKSPSRRRVSRTPGPSCRRSCPWRRRCSRMPARKWSRRARTSTSAGCRSRPAGRAMSGR
ncbi:hypothetical protein ACP3P8_04920 [Pseudomonas aeruginosa]